MLNVSTALLLLLIEIKNYNLYVLTSKIAASKLPNKLSRVNVSNLKVQVILMIELHNFVKYFDSRH